MENKLVPFNIDAFRLSCLNDPLVINVWENKYRFGDEKTPLESKNRVIKAIMEGRSTPEEYEEAAWAIHNGYFLPAGRINAGAGTGRDVTLNNCYVGEIMNDSMAGIQHAIANSAFTLQQGGGIGNDFSPLRPSGAIVGKTGSVASGPIAFMDQMSGMSEAICSAGERRGAMMTTLAIDHPDVWHRNQFETRKNYNGDDVLLNPSFISVKRQKGRLTQTNISVLVSDAFMRAVKHDENWLLGHFVPRADGKHIAILPKLFPYDYISMNKKFQIKETTGGHAFWKKGELLPWYVYETVKARQLWDDLMRSTYTYAEPGVIFIDQVNARNNLNYCEDITCSNPCGEQVLPPHGCCTLGSINLAFMVQKPFTDEAYLDRSIFARAISIAVHFLDNVLDVTGYPLEEQRQEAMNKRRIGLGLTGVADALIQLKIRYGSSEALEYITSWSQRLQIESYKASALLASERGGFPFYSSEILNSTNIKALPSGVKQLISNHGLRNGVLNTVAPNGTISIYSGNTAQGIEPVFSFSPVIRKVRQPDGTLLEMRSVNYSQRLYEAMNISGEVEGDYPLPDYFIGADQLTPNEHITMQAACQDYIDASISKTVNCPTDMTFEAFKEVYKTAYDLGCKGCTTYRYDPAAGRGSVLSTTETVYNSEPELHIKLTPEKILDRPRVVKGRTYKLKWPIDGKNWYINVTHTESGEPLEVFLTGGDAAASEWVQAVSRLITAVLRRGGDVRFLIHQLQAVHSSVAGAFIPDQNAYRPSVVAAIAGVLEEEFKALGLYSETDEPVGEIREPRVVPVTLTKGSGADACPICFATPLIREEGCARCANCNYYKCG